MSDTPTSLRSIPEVTDKKITSAAVTICAASDVSTLSGPVQYIVRNGTDYYLSPEIPLRGRLPAGSYRPYASPQGYFARTVPVKSDRLLHLPYRVFHEVLRDIRVFWEQREAFKNYGLVHKRGILLYGPPGSGKTSLVLLLQKMLVEEKDGIVFVLTSPNDVSDFIGFMESGFRATEPNREIIVLIEDIDSIIASSNAEGLLLQLLDGAKQMDNVVYLATTNHLDRLEARITNRPSRFDRVYEVGFPDAKIREYYLRHLIKPEDQARHDLSAWAEKTNGLTFAHLRDVVVSVILLKLKFEDVLTHMRGLAGKPQQAARNGSEAIGFGGGLANKSTMDYDDNDWDDGFPEPDNGGKLDVPAPEEAELISNSNV
jgi:energy-coupling factor transporter ATP-binding protein EcfA2